MKDKVVIICLASLFICFSNLIYLEYYKSQSRYDVVLADLVVIQGKLHKPIHLHTSKSKAGVPEKLFVTLHLKNHTEFSFTSVMPYKRFEFDDLSSINLADSIFVVIRKEEYEQKLAKITPLSLWNKYMDYHNIDFYGLATQKEIILDKTNYLKNNIPNDDLQKLAAFLLNSLITIGSGFLLYVTLKSFFVK